MSTLKNKETSIKKSEDEMLNYAFLIEQCISIAPEKGFSVSEMKNIKHLFNRAKAGIVFIGETKKRIGSKIELMENQLPFERLQSATTAKDLYSGKITALNLV